MIILLIIAVITLVLGIIFTAKGFRKHDQWLMNDDTKFGDSYYKQAINTTFTGATFIGVAITLTIILYLLIYK